MLLKRIFVSVDTDPFIPDVIYTKVEVVVPDNKLGARLVATKTQIELHGFKSTFQQMLGSAERMILDEVAKMDP